ncbi:amidohydrolase family protein, partial [Streptomyces mirabilis]
MSVCIPFRMPQASGTGEAGAGENPTSTSQRPRSAFVRPTPCGLPQQPQPVQPDQHRGALVARDAERQREVSEQVPQDEDRDERTRDKKVLDHQAAGRAGQPYDRGDRRQLVADDDGVRRLQREVGTRPAQRTEAQRAALAHAASLGIGSVHECAGPEISSEDDFTGLLRLAAEEAGPRVVGYWAEQDVDKARALGAIGAAGDLFVDGSLGSYTACLHQPYADADHTGTAYLDAAAVGAHVVACTEAGLQAGFHAIGDAAVTAVVEGVRAAAEKLGLARVRAARHRVEHAEMLTPETIAG